MVALNPTVLHPYPVQQRRHEIVKVGAQWVMQLYAAYADCGPYCVGWIPLKAEERVRAESALKESGSLPLDLERDTPPHPWGWK